MLSFELRLTLVILAALLVSSCGGGSGNASGSGSGNPPSPPPTSLPFGVSVDSATVSVAAGGTAILKLTLTGATTAAATVSGLPSGVSIFPAQPLLLTSGAQSVFLSTTAAVPVGNYSITLQATSGQQTSSASVVMQVTAGPPSSVSGPPLFLVLTPGGNSEFLLYCIPASGQSCSMSVIASGIPPGVTLNPAQPFQIDQNGTPVTLSASDAAAIGDYGLVFTGSANGYSSSLPIELHVANGSFTLVSPQNSQYAVRFGSSANISLQTIANVVPGQVENYSVQMSISGLPSGVTASFSPSTFAPGANTTLTVSASANAPLTRNARIYITATPNVNAPASAISLLIDVVPPPGQLPISRTDFVNTNGDVLGAVYDPVHQLVFASNNYWNRVEVYSLAQKQIVSSIRIPAPEALEMSVDGTKVLVGTDTPQIFWIDTSSLQVVGSARFPAPSQTAVQGLQAAHPHALSNGKILMHYRVQNLTATGVTLWDPTSGSTSSIPLTTAGNSIGWTARSGDGTKVIISTDDSFGYSYLYDVASNAITTSLTGVKGPVAADPSGTHFLVGSTIYDANLKPVGTTPSSMLSNQITGSIFSPDGKTAYVVENTAIGAAIFSLDASNSTLLSVGPALEINTAIGSAPPVVETPFTADSTGLIFGGTNHGMAVDDAAYQTNSAAFGGFSGTLTPPVGPVGISTATQTHSLSLLPDVYIGDQPAQSVTRNSTTGVINFNVPPISTPGPQNLKMFFPNGEIGLGPLAFSYGPSIQALNGNSASTGGGSTLQIVALGVPSDPAQVRVTIGGQNATVMQASAYIPPFFGPFDFLNAFPSQLLQVTVPAGANGASDVTLTTPAGTTTAVGGFHYVTVTNYPSSDTFTGMLYDRFRNQLYLSAGDHIDVFSVATGAFITGIIPPSINGQRSFSTAIALTPDGSSLLAINSADNSLAVINPDNVSASKAISLGCSTQHTGVAATNDGRALLMTTFTGGSCPSGTPGTGLLAVDLTSGTLNQLAPPSQCMPGSLRGSNDGMKVGLSSSQAFCVLDVASNNYAVSSSTYNSDFDVSGDGAVFASGPFLTDPSTNILGYLHYPDFYAPLSNVLPFEKLHDSGSLLYVPYASSLDVWDVNQGELRRRISIGQTIEPSLPMMTVDSTGQQIFLFAHPDSTTGPQLTRIQLDFVPLSLGHASPMVATAGSTITVRGTGFQVGSAITINGVTAASTFVDSSTINCTLPSLPAGPVTITVTNPNGETASLGHAVTIQ